MESGFGRPGLRTVSLLPRASAVFIVVGSEADMFPTSKLGQGRAEARRTGSGAHREDPEGWVAQLLRGTSSPLHCVFLDSPPRFVLLDFCLHCSSQALAHRPLASLLYSIYRRCDPRGDRRLGLISLPKKTSLTVSQERSFEGV